MQFFVHLFDCTTVSLDNKSFVLKMCKKKDVIITLAILYITNKKGICKNCGDDIGDDGDSDIFCSEQCEVEYQMEHDRK